MAFPLAIIMRQHVKQFVCAITTAIVGYNNHVIKKHKLILKKTAYRGFFMPYYWFLKEDTQCFEPQSYVGYELHAITGIEKNYIKMFFFVLAGVF